MSGWDLAIDFATTNTVVAVRWGSGQVELVRLGEGDPMPSSVMLSEGSTLVAGPNLIQEAERALERLKLTPKNQLGHEQVLLGGEVFRDIGLVAAVLDHPASKACRHVNDEVQDWVVLTCPATWESTKCQLLVEAAVLASLPAALESFVAEPVAAATALLQREEAVAAIGAEGARTPPSVVGLSKSDEVLVGEVVKRQAVTPTRTAPSRRSSATWARTTGMSTSTRSATAPRRSRPVLRRRSRGNG
jgi:molecular chaperone DnaK (HSP70)